jgi:hypothetical protein
MPQCIFCEDGDLPEETEECPHCGNKPFSGMYFDPEQYARAEALEAENKLEEAWKLLQEEWMGHSDRDYFDHEMVMELEAKLHELFLRHPVLAPQRMELYELSMSSERFWGHFASEGTLKEAIKAMLKVEREDLAEELVDMHFGINWQNVHPRPNDPTADNVTSYIDIVRKEMEGTV